MVLDKSQGGGEARFPPGRGGGLSDFLEKCSLRVDRLGGTSEWNIEQKKRGCGGWGASGYALEYNSYMSM